MVEIGFQIYIKNKMDRFHLKQAVQPDTIRSSIFPLKKTTHTQLILREWDQLDLW